MADVNSPRGLFGIRGAARDIIGTLGDAFLIGSGLQPIYSAQRQNERTGEALSGLINPQGTTPQEIEENRQRRLLELSRLNPALAQKYLSDQQETRLKTAKLQADVRDKSLENYSKGLGLISQMYSAANPETYARLLPVIQRTAQNYGVDIDELGIGDQYDPNIASFLGESQVPLVERYKQRISTEQKEKDRESRERLARLREEGAMARTNLTTSAADRRQQASIAAAREGRAESHRNRLEQIQVREGARGGLGRRKADTGSQRKLVVRNGKLVVAGDD